MKNEVQDGHPCESCLRWPECNGVDWPTCQAENTDTLATFAREVMQDVLEQTTAVAYQIVRDAYTVLGWAIRTRPRLVHLAAWAKKGKDRKKNLSRIIREYIKGD